MWPSGRVISSRLEGRGFETRPMLDRSPTRSMISGDLTSLMLQINRVLGSKKTRNWLANFVIKGLLSRRPKNETLSGKVRGRGRDKVEFYEVDKHFWHANSGQNWLLRFRSTENDYIVFVDIYNSSYVDLKNWIFFVDFKHISQY